jgi:hypothetical protein
VRPGLSADKGFINLHLTTQFSASEIALPGEPSTLQHEPRCFLSDAHSAMDLPGGNAVLAIYQIHITWAAKQSLKTNASSIERIALVTGAKKGIGFEIARQIGRTG